MGGGGGWGGEDRKQKRGGWGAEKISQKKQNLVARKRNQEKRKTFLQPDFVPLPGKSHAPKKRLVWGGGCGGPEWAEACFKDILTWLVEVFATCWKRSGVRGGGRGGEGRPTRSPGHHPRRPSSGPTRHLPAPPD